MWAWFVGVGFDRIASAMRNEMQVARSLTFFHFVVHHYNFIRPNCKLFNSNLCSKMDTVQWYGLHEIAIALVSEQASYLSVCVAL